MRFDGQGATGPSERDLVSKNKMDGSQGVPRMTPEVG